METSTPVKREYAPVNGLEMYYDIHEIQGVPGPESGSPPLVLLHEPANIVTSFCKVLPRLSSTRKIIAVEQQGHGHTADIDRVFSIGPLAEDTAALLRYLEIEEADFFGYSSAGTTHVMAAERAEWLATMVTSFLDAPVDAPAGDGK